MKELERYKSNTLLPMNLQLFAEPTDPTDPANPVDPAEPPNPTDPVDPADQGKDAKTYTQDEVEEIIKQRVAREKKVQEKAIEEAKKLAQMNEEEKRQFELEKLQKELEDLRKEKNFSSLSREASKMLSEEGIKVSDDVLGFVVKDSAEDTSVAVKAFVNLVNAKAEEITKQRLSGTPPRVPVNNGGAWTKEKIMQIKDTTKRQKLIAENKHLFK